MFELLDAMNELSDAGGLEDETRGEVLWQHPVHHVLYLVEFEGDDHTQFIQLPLLLQL